MDPLAALSGDTFDGKSDLEARVASGGSGALSADSFEVLLRNSTAVRMLRAEQAGVLLGFLYAAFKIPGRLTIPFSELGALLEQYLEHRSEVESEGEVQLTRNPVDYLNRWCDSRHGYLRKFYDETRDEPMVELTPGAEKALEWVEGLSASHFVGTESRFLQIVTLLEELVEFTEQDPQKRLEQLQRQVSELQAEMRRLEEGGGVNTLNQTQVRERVFRSVEESRRLLSDFRQIEANFRDLARGVREKHVASATGKGALLGEVLDAEGELRGSDQGRSFLTFYRFLMSPQKQDAWDALIQKVRELPQLEAMEAESGFLRDTKFRLMDAADKVQRGNHQLGEQLRRLLDTQNAEEGRRVMELCREIQKHFLTSDGARLDSRETFHSWEAWPEVLLPMDRPLYQPRSEKQLPVVQKAVKEVDASVIESLMSGVRLDLERLRVRVAQFLLEKPSVTLREVLERWPSRYGLTEVAGYLRLAREGERHIIEEGNRERFVIENRATEDRFQVLLPRVIFLAEGERQSERSTKERAEGQRGSAHQREQSGAIHRAGKLDSTLDAKLNETVNPAGNPEAHRKLDPKLNPKVDAKVEPKGNLRVDRSEQINRREQAEEG